MWFLWWLYCRLVVDRCWVLAYSGYRRWSKGFVKIHESVGIKEVFWLLEWWVVNEENYRWKAYIELAASVIDIIVYELVVVEGSLLCIYGLCKGHIDDIDFLGWPAMLTKLRKNILMVGQIWYNQLRRIVFGKFLLNKGRFSGVHALWLLLY